MTFRAVVLAESAWRELHDCDHKLWPSVLGGRIFAVPWSFTQPGVYLGAFFCQECSGSWTLNLSTSQIRRMWITRRSACPSHPERFVRRVRHTFPTTASDGH